MKTFIYFFIAIAFFACSSNTSETPNGTKITYFKSGDGGAPVDSLVSLFNIRYTTAKDSVILEADSDNPRPIKIDPASDQDQGELFEVLKMLKVGDSVGFEIGASGLYSKTFRQPIPPFVDPESNIKFQIAYLDQVSEEDYYKMVSEKAEEAAEKQLAEDLEILDDYLYNNQIEVQKTESGLRYTINQEGNGQKPEQGQKVKVNYAGRILDGEYFDTSLEDVAKEQGLYQEQREYKPFEFEIGKGMVIKGWDEGISLLNEGTKATLYIPSTLAYGSRSAGNIIKPNSILVFDVELVGVGE